MRFLTIAMLLVLGGFTGASVGATDDFVLDKSGPVRVEIDVSEDVLAPTTHVAVIFSAKGSRQLRPDGSISVNGTLLQGKPKMKAGVLGSFQVGYAYAVMIPKASQYEVVFRRAAGQPEVRYLVIPREFRPHVPFAISRNRDLRIPFDGGGQTKAERPYVRISAPESAPRQNNWSVFLSAHIEGNQFIIPVSSIRGAKTGSADLHVGIISNQQSMGTQDRVAYAISQHFLVEITD